MIIKTLRVILVYLLAFLFTAVGVLHFTHPDGFVDIVPAMLPWPLALVYISGLFEILGGVGLALPWSRRWASYVLLALLIAVYPANINMWWNDVPMNGATFSGLEHGIRLPFQFVLMAWTYWAGRCIGIGANAAPRKTAEPSE